LFNDGKLYIKEMTHRVGCNEIPQFYYKTVSHYHVANTCREGAYYFKEIAELRNGTSINGVLLDKQIEYKLKRGDKIRFADIECEFRMGNE